MKIVFVVRAINKLGGTEKATIDQANLLAENSNHDIHIISMYKYVRPEETFYPYVSNLINIHFINKKLPLLKYGDISHRVLDVVSSYKVRKIIETISPDICIFTAIRDFKKEYIGKYKNVLMVHFSYDEYLKGRFTRTLFNIYSSQFEKVVFLSPLDANDYKLKTGNTNGIYINNYCRISPYGKDFSKVNKRIIFVGRLDEKQKQLSHVVKIIDILSRDKVFEGWKLDVYGKGDAEIPLKNLVVNKKLNDFIKFKGISNNMNEVYDKYDIAILTSNYEGLPLYLIEASLKGIPIVSYDCSPGISSIIVDTKTGFLIEKNNIEMFSDKLKYLIINHNTLKSMSLAAQAHAQKNFSKDAILELWLRMLEKL